MMMIAASAGAAGGGGGRSNLSRLAAARVSRVGQIRVGPDTESESRRPGTSLSVSTTESRPPPSESESLSQLFSPCGVGLTTMSIEQFCFLPSFGKSLVLPGPAVGGFLWTLKRLYICVGNEISANFASCNHHPCDCNDFTFMRSCYIFGSHS